MTKNNNRPIPEKVCVFVSSTIEQCKDEREVAKKAIASLNHAPLLFENAGARSYPPRALYLRMIHSAHIFIGIYRHEYGWVAPDMSISGIEDEFRNATARGMPRLIYIIKDDLEKDEKLTNFLDEIMLESGLTIAFYKRPSDLYARIRDDIEAEVARTFHDREQLEASLSTNAELVLEAVLPERRHFVRRPDIIEKIEEGIRNNFIVQVCGPAGIGKTVLLADFALQKKSIFVAASHLSRKDLAAVIATKIRQLSGAPIRSYVDMCSAYSDLVSVWQEPYEFNVILDDCRDPDFITSLLNDVGGTQAGKSLVFSTRIAFEVPNQFKVIVPAMTAEQIRELVTVSRGKETEDTELLDLINCSQGNPLYIRFHTLDKEAEVKRDLTSFEKSYWQSLTPRSQEIIGYISISPFPLGIDDFLLLVGTSSSSDIIPAIDQIRPYLRDEVLGYSLLHDHIEETILGLLKKEQHRYAYYARRLAKYFKKKGDAISAYFILDKVGDVAAIQLANRATFDALRHGNISQALHILDSKLCAEKEARKDQETVFTLLTIAKVKEGAGFAHEARSAAEDALDLAKSIADNALILRAREVRAACLIRQSLDPEALDELKDLKKIYEGEEDAWSCARLDLDIGAILIRMKRYDEAEAHTRAALSIFDQIDDVYGISLAKRNLASILSESPGHEDEVSAILKEFNVDMPQKGNERERAWFCNLMIRKCRRSEDYIRAEQYGLEAISIGEKFGDANLVALNRICLGNVYRDEKEYDKALKEYFQAAKDAQKIGDRSLEASTSNLIASIYNRMGNTDLAIQFATHAIALVRDTLAITELSDSFEELARAYLATNQDEKAAGAYIDAAFALKNSQREEEMSRLALEGLFIYVENNLVRQYIDALAILWDMNVITGDFSKLTPIEQLYDVTWPLLQLVPRRHMIDFLGLHFRLMFNGIPKTISRYLFRKISRRLLALEFNPTENWRILFPILPLLVSVPTDIMQMFDIVDLADELHRVVPDISFKPKSDGAAHWVLNLDLQTPFLCSITQLDDGTDTATAAMILALFLKGFEVEIREELTTGVRVACDEIPIQICNTRDLPDGFEKYLGPSVKSDVCAVTRPTDMADTVVPTIVICRDDIAENWGAGKRKGSAMQMLVGISLAEIAYRLFKGEVDMETLRPKIVGIVRRTIS